MNNPITTIRNFLSKPTVTQAFDRGFYEGGKVTKANQDFWNANSDFETTAVADRDKLRARARWLSGNNPIMDNIDNAIINNTVGKGIMFQSITGKTKFDADVEERFMRWCKTKNMCDARGQHTFSIMQRLMIKTRMVDGEIFIYKKVTKTGLEIQLMEAESLDSGRSDGGIELDGNGKIAKYHFKDAKGKAIAIKADYIINYYMPERATQYRGISEYKQAIIDIKNFSGFQTASIQGARARANIAYAVKQNGKTDPYGGNMKDKTQTVNGVTVMYLGVGEEISKLDPDSVATDYVQFSENTIRLIATARKVSYELAFRDYSKVNFASSRASLLQDHKRFDVEQDHFVDTVLTDIYASWLEVEILRGTVKANGYDKDPHKWIKPKWIMPKRDLVDPLKEITAIEKKIKLNLTCETDVANSEGEDYEEILKKKAKEIELKEQYGLPDYTLIEDTSTDDNTDDGEVDIDENMTGAESSNTKGGNDAKSKKDLLRNQTRTRSIGCIAQRGSEEGQDSTLTFTFVSNDNAGVRYDWGTGEYYNEILDVNGADTSRLTTFFKDHVRNVDGAIAKVSNTRVDNGQLIGDVTFGSDADSQRVFTKYAEGILTDVSIGYEIRDYKIEKGATNERDNVTVTSYDVFEVSAVGIGFDKGAKKREEELNGGTLEMNEKLMARLALLTAIAVTDRTAEQSTELTKLEAKRDAETLERANELKKVKAENANLIRQEAIRVLCAKHDVDLTLRDGYVADAETTVDMVRDAILENRVKATPVIVPSVLDADTNMRLAIKDGLALRAGITVAKPHPDAEQYRYASLISIGNALLPEHDRSMNPNTVAERSLLTGDFPLMLQSIGARVLTSEFEASSGSYKIWCKEVDVPDFRVMSDVTGSMGGGRLSKVKENGDLIELGGKESAETWKIGSYGNTFILTREAMINDDLGTFTGLIAGFGEMAQRTANGIAYDVLQQKGDFASYKMGDGSGVFIAGRNNTSTAVLSSVALSAGKLAMSKHLGLDGKTPLNITPKFLIVPPALEVTALEILGALSKVGADNVNVPNVNKQAYILVVDAEITSDTAWYLMAERRTIKLGFLAGTNRSPVIKTNDSSISRTKLEGVFDIGGVVEDYKGMFRGNV